jgi:PAS domain S-box-containing protein
MYSNYSSDEVVLLHRQIARLEKQVEAAQKQQQALQELLHSVYDSVTHPIFVIDVLESGQLYYAGWNRAAELITGIPSYVVSGKTPLEVLGETRGSVLLQRCRECLDRKTALTYVDNCFGADWQRWEINLSPVLGTDNQISRIVGTGIDRTNQHNTEQELYQRELILRAFVEYSPASIAIFDNQMRYLAVSRKWLEEYKVQEADIIGRCHYDVVPDIPEQWRQIHQRCLAGAIESSDGDVFRREDGHLEWVRWEVRPWYVNPGQIGGIILLAEVITAQKQAELEQSRLLAILENSSDFVGTADTEGNLLYLNLAARQVLGLAADAPLTGLTFGQCHPVWANQVIAEQAWPALVEQGIWTGENAILGVDNQEVPVLQQIIAHRSEQGEVAYFSMVARDISALKQTQKNLEAMKRRFQSIFEQAAVGISHESFQGEPMLCNQKYCDILGYSREELEVIDYVQRTHPDDLPLDNYFTEKLWDGQISSFAMEKRYIRKDRSIVWTNLSITIVRDESGNPLEAVVIVQDINDRKATEAKLQQQQLHMQAIIENLPCRLWLKDKDGKYIIVNQEFCNFVNLPREQIIGKQPGDIWDWELAEKFIGQDQEIIKSGKSASLEDDLIVTGIGRRWFLTTKTPIYGPSGEFAGLVGIAMDITDRRLAELHAQQQAAELAQAIAEIQRTQSQLIQSEKMSSLGELVAGVAHEINNPVNFIYGNLAHASEYTKNLLHLLKLYQQKYPDPDPAIQDLIDDIDLDFVVVDLPKLMDSMKVGAERIQKIVQSLRNFSRMDEAEQKAVDIHEGIDSTLMILQHRLKPKGDRSVQIIKEYGNLPVVNCYPGQLNQVFMNILANALDALEERDEARSPEQIRAEPSQIKIITDQPEPNWARIRIIDNGAGMTELTRQRLFNPFFTTKPVGKGTGMGLSISYQIVNDRHGGSLECISAPGQGAEFIIRIPV